MPYRYEPPRHRGLFVLNAAYMFVGVCILIALGMALWWWWR